MNCTKPFTYFYAYANDMISDPDFEQWLYKNTELVESFLNEEMYFKLLEADFGSFKAVKHIKWKLQIVFAELFSSHPHDEWISGSDDELKAMISHKEDEDTLRGKLVIECGDIVNSKQLHNRLHRIFRFPYWYGKNWDALNDLIDLSEVTEIELHDYKQLQAALPSETKILLEILNDHKRTDCRIITE